MDTINSTASVRSQLLGLQHLTMEELIEKWKMLFHKDPHLREVERVLNEAVQNNGHPGIEIFDGADGLQLAQGTFVEEENFLDACTGLNGGTGEGYQHLNEAGFEGKEVSVAGEENIGQHLIKECLGALLILVCNELAQPFLVADQHLGAVGFTQLMLHGVELAHKLLLIVQVLAVAVLDGTGHT